MFTDSDGQFLAMHFKSWFSACSYLEDFADGTTLVDLLHTADGGACVFLSGKNLESSLKQVNKKQALLAVYYRKTFPLKTLQAFYSLNKPDSFESLLFAEVHDIPTTLEFLEESLHLQASVLIVYNQRSYKKNNIVISVQKKLYKDTLESLKKKFKKVKVCGIQNPQPSLLEFLTILKPE